MEDKKIYTETLSTTNNNSASLTEDFKSAIRNLHKIFGVNGIDPAKEIKVVSYRFLEQEGNKYHYSVDFEVIK